MTITSVQNFYDNTLAYYQGRGLKNRVQRDWQYIRTPGQEDLLYSLVGAVLALSVGGMFTGIEGAKRAIEGLEISGEGQQNTILAFGGGGGLFVGGGLAAMGHFRVVEGTRTFISWVEAKEKTVLREALRERFEKDEVLSNFICPVSHSPILSAARSPAGHLYDYNSLVRCATQSDGMIKDPFRVPNSKGSILFSVSEVHEDPEACLVIEKRLKFLLERDMIELDPDSSTCKTLRTHSNELKKIIRSEYRKAQDQIRIRKENAETDSISEEEEYRIREQFDVEMAVFCHHFGKVSSENLDWTRTDWAELIDRRWKLFPH